MRLLMRAAGAVCLSMVLAATASAQGLQGGIKAGWDHPTFGGKDVQGSGFTGRNDFAGGLFLTIPAGPTFAVQPELLYVPKGAQVSGSEGAITYTGKVKLDYVEIPLLARVKVPLENAAVRPMLFAGPYVAFKTSCKVEVSGYGISGSSDCGAGAPQDSVKSTDFGLTFGGGLELPLGGVSAFVDARYDLGLTSLDATAQPIDIKNRAVLVFVGFSFPLGSARTATQRSR